MHSLAEAKVPAKPCKTHQQPNWKIGALSKPAWQPLPRFGALFDEPSVEQLHLQEAGRDHREAEGKREGRER